jgi:hypothetical protein
VFVGLEPHADFVIEDAQVAVRTALDRIRPNNLHFLRHDADVRLVAAVIGKPVEAKAVVEVTEQDDVVLERDVRTPAATAAAATTATTTAATSAATGGYASAVVPFTETIDEVDDLLTLTGLRLIHERNR